jgi:hypothetical protein
MGGSDRFDDEFYRTSRPGGSLLPGQLLRQQERRQHPQREIVLNGDPERLTPKPEPVIAAPAATTVIAATGTRSGLRKKRPGSGQREAIEFLHSQLAAGARLSRDVYDAADQRGVSVRTLGRARKALGVQATHRRGEWWLRLPDEAA